MDASVSRLAPTSGRSAQLVVSIDRLDKHEKIFNPQQTQDLTFNRANATAHRVVYYQWVPQRQVLPPGPQAAAVGGKDVLDPVAVHAVGESDADTGCGPEHVHRRLVASPGMATLVRDHSEPWALRGDVPGDPVQPDPVQTCDEPGEWHMDLPSIVRGIRMNSAVFSTRCRCPTFFASRPIDDRSYG